MRKIVLVLITALLTVSGFAQKTADIGIWGGTSTYWGDIEKAFPLQTFNLNVGVFFRYNFNARVALRTSFMTGSFASEGFIEDVPFGFSKNAQDLTAMVEINYLKYILGNKKTPFTPYILGGMGIMYYPYTLDTGDLSLLGAVNPNHPLVRAGAAVEESVISLVVPFGFGIKFSVGERLGIGAEYQLRKLFDDKLDNMDDPLAFNHVNDEGVTETIKYSDFWHKTDWPGYLGVFITWKIFTETKACPAYDRKYW
jgi:hypothetical protein